MLSMVIYLFVHTHLAQFELLGNSVMQRSVIARNQNVAGYVFVAVCPGLLMCLGLVLFLGVVMSLVGLLVVIVLALRMFLALVMFLG